MTEWIKFGSQIMPLEHNLDHKLTPTPLNPLTLTLIPTPILTPNPRALTLNLTPLNLTLIPIP